MALHRGGLSAPQLCKHASQRYYSDPEFHAAVETIASAVGADLAAKVIDARMEPSDLSLVRFAAAVALHARSVGLV